MPEFSSYQKIEREPNFEELDRVMLALPEVQAGDNLWQNRFHEFDVLTHTKKFIEHLNEFTTDANVRAAGWLHDIGKPVVARPKFDKEGNRMQRDPEKLYHEFTDHEIVGEEMVKKMPADIFEKLALDQEKIASLVGCHYLPMKGIQEMRRTTNFNDFVAAFEKLDATLSQLTISKEEVLAMFIADSLAKGSGCTDQPELLPIREVLLMEKRQTDDYRRLYEIEKNFYKNKE